MGCTHEWMLVVMILIEKKCTVVIAFCFALHGKILACDSSCYALHGDADTVTCAFFCCISFSCRLTSQQRTIGTTHLMIMEISTSKRLLKRLNISR